MTASATAPDDKKADPISQLKRYSDPESSFQLDGNDEGYNSIVPQRKLVYAMWTQKIKTAVLAEDKSNPHQLLKTIQLFLSIDHNLTRMLLATDGFSYSDQTTIKNLANLIYQSACQNKFNDADWVFLENLIASNLVMTRKTTKSAPIDKVYQSVVIPVMQKNLCDTIQQTQSLLAMHGAERKVGLFEEKMSVNPMPLLRKYLLECQQLSKDFDTVLSDPEETEKYDQINSACQEFQTRMTAKFNLLNNFTRSFEKLTSHDRQLAVEFAPEKDKILEKMSKLPIIAINLSTPILLAEIDLLVHSFVKKYQAAKELAIYMEGIKFYAKKEQSFAPVYQQLVAEINKPNVPLKNMINLLEHIDSLMNIPHLDAPTTAKKLVAILAEDKELPKKIVDIQQVLADALKNQKFVSRFS